VANRSCKIFSLHQNTKYETFSLWQRSVEIHHALVAAEKKYKKCCLLLPDGATLPEPQPTKFIPVYTELDQLSNSVMDLNKKMNKLDEAEAVIQKDF